MTDLPDSEQPFDLDLASAYDYHLPPQLIAQQPASPRDHARLLRLNRATGGTSHHRFDALPQLLRPDDLLVFNDTRVLRARLRGYKINDAAHEYSCREASASRTDAATELSAPRDHSGNQRDEEVDKRGARVEALLLRELEPNLWESLLKPSSRLRPGTPLVFESRDGRARISASPVERTEAGWKVRFDGDLRSLLPQIGEVPLPPYIEAALRDEAHYQTIYARGRNGASSAREQAATEDSPHMSTHAAQDDEQEQSGEQLESAAAPTAGLHFTERTFAELQARGIATAFVTLQIGLGTFRPMKSDSLDEHAMHSEDFEIPLATQRLIERQRARGGRVVAVGTTTTRVLEAAADGQGGVRAGLGRTGIFIRPGHCFAVVDALLTNFHLPRSTLLVMIAAFAANRRDDAAQAMPESAPESSPEAAMSGLQKIRYAYSQAVDEGYRFFSFGDAMLIE